MLVYTCLYYNYNSLYLLNKCPNLKSILSNVNLAALNATASTASLSNLAEDTNIAKAGNKEVYASNAPITNKKASNKAIVNKDSNTPIDNNKD